MKKILLSAVLCLIGIASNSAQTGTDVAMATLQSGDNVSVFYGKDAFKNAYEAAADSGDVITLSAGLFSTPYRIQKSLSIIGNGYIDDQVNGKYPTWIESDFRFSPRDIVDNDGETITEAIGYDGTRIEGLNIMGSIFLEGSRTVHNFSIVKCNTNRIYLSSNTVNTTIRQCVVYGQFRPGQKNHPNLYIVGSYINNLYGTPDDGIINIDHCVINGSIDKGTITNSILENASSGVTAYNCIFMGNTPSYIIGTGNWYDCKYAGIFEREGITNLGLSYEDNYFALKYPSDYVGTDGTQVGLYGGPYPYNPTPTTPQIIESKIDTTIAEDGVLKVNVTVEAQTEN